MPSLLQTSRACSSLNGSILQAAPRRTDRQLPREHFYSPDKPKRCRLGMPPNSPQKSALCRAPPSQETTSASAASARAPEKILAFHDTSRRNFIERAKLWSCIPCTLKFAPFAVLRRLPLPKRETTRLARAPLFAGARARENVGLSRLLQIRLHRAERRPMPPSMSVAARQCR